MAGRAPPSQTSRIGDSSIRTLLSVWSVFPSDLGDDDHACTRGVYVNPTDHVGTLCSSVRGSDNLLIMATIRQPSGPPKREPGRRRGGRPFSGAGLSVAEHLSDHEQRMPIRDPPNWSPRSRLPELPMPTSRPRSRARPWKPKPPPSRPNRYCVRYRLEGALSYRGIGLRVCGRR